MQSEWRHNCVGNADFFYQETDLSQISLVISSKTVKVSEPSFLYILSNTACDISRIHANTNNLLFQKPSSSKIMGEVNVLGRLFPYGAFPMSEM